MSIDRLLESAADELRQHSFSGRDAEGMLTNLRDVHRRRRAVAGGLAGVAVFAGLLAGWLAFGSISADREPPSGPVRLVPSPDATVFVDPGGCDLDCQWRHEDSGLIRPGALPVGDYVTQWFYPGRLTVTLPDGWSSGEDSTGWLNLVPPGAADGASIHFWLDAAPITKHREPVIGVANTPQTVAAWLLTNPDLDVTTRDATDLGEAGLATTLDVEVASSAKNYAGSGCPTKACVFTFAMDSQWDSARKADGAGITRTGWPIGRGVSYVRMSLAQVNGDHLLFVVIDAPTQAERDALAVKAAPVLASLRLATADR